MADQVKVTMLLYSNLQTGEAERLEQLDNAVGMILIRAEITSRCWWAGDAGHGDRVIRLVDTQAMRAIFEITPRELDSITDEILLVKLDAAVSTAGIIE